MRRCLRSRLGSALAQQLRRIEMRQVRIEAKLDDLIAAMDEAEEESAVMVTLDGESFSRRDARTILDD